MTLSELHTDRSIVRQDAPRTTDARQSRAIPAEASTTRAIVFMYAGYAFRYLYLLILVPFYGRVLGPAEYGRVLAAMSLFQMVWMLGEYGFPAVGMRDIAMERTSANMAAVYGRHTTGRLVTAAAGLLVGACGTVISPVLRERPIFGVLATLTGVTSAFNLGWFFQGVQRFRTSVIIEVIGFAINLPLVLLLVRSKDDGWLVLLALLVSSVIATCIAHGIALRMMGRGSIRWGGAFPLVRESTALFAHRGLTLLMSSSSTLIISMFADAQQVGWYGSAERLATAGVSLLQPANQVLIGTVAALINVEQTKARAYSLVRRGLVVLTALGTLMFVGTMAVAGFAVPLILGPQFGPSVAILRILSLMFPFAAFDQVVTGYVLIPLRYDRLASGVALFGAIVTVVLTLGLGITFHGGGVAWARALGYIAMALVLAETLRRKGLIHLILKTR